MPSHQSRRLDRQPAHADSSNDVPWCHIEKTTEQASREDMSPVTEKTRDLSELLSKMDDYVVASAKKAWLS